MTRRWENGQERHDGGRDQGIGEREQAPSRPFIQDHRDDTGSLSSTFYGAYTLPGDLTFGGWSTIVFVLPAATISPLLRIGVEFYAAGAWTGIVCVDSISW